MYYTTVIIIIIIIITPFVPAFVAFTYFIILFLFIMQIFCFHIFLMFYSHRNFPDISVLIIFYILVAHSKPPFHRTCP